LNSIRGGVQQGFSTNTKSKQSDSSADVSNGKIVETTPAILFDIDGGGENVVVVVVVVVVVGLI
jgi:hypothetical protein